MKRIIFAVLCVLISLSLYAQVKEDKFWSLLSFSEGKVMTYQTTATPIDFLGKILVSYCFVGNEQQVYADVFKNNTTTMMQSIPADANGNYIFDIGENGKPIRTVDDIPVESTYTVSLTSSSKLSIVLTKERKCTSFNYLTTDDEGDHPGASSWQVFKCDEWQETYPNRNIELTKCVNWETPLKEYLIQAYSLPKQLFN